MNAKHLINMFEVAASRWKLGLPSDQKNRINSFIAQSKGKFLQDEVENFVKDEIKLIYNDPKTGELLKSVNINRYYRLDNPIESLFFLADDDAIDADNEDKIKAIAIIRNNRNIILNILQDYYNKIENIRPVASVAISPQYVSRIIANANFDVQNLTEWIKKFK